MVVNNNLKNFKVAICGLDFFYKMHRPHGGAVVCGDDFAQAYLKMKRIAEDQHND